jgi:hypothetical protein
MENTTYSEDEAIISARRLGPVVVNFLDDNQEILATLDTSELAEIPDIFETLLATIERLDNEVTDLQNRLEEQDE